MSAIKKGNSLTEPKQDFINLQYLHVKYVLKKEARWGSAGSLIKLKNIYLRDSKVCR